MLPFRQTVKKIKLFIWKEAFSMGKLSPEEKSDFSRLGKKEVFKVTEDTSIHPEHSIRS